MTLVLEKINKSIPKLLESQSLKEHCDTILKEIVEITQIKSGTLFLSDEYMFVQKSFINFNKSIKIYKNDKIKKFIEKGKAVVKTKRELSEYECCRKVNVNYALFLPLIYHHESIGFIVLFPDKKPIISKKEASLINLFLVTASATTKKIEMHSQVQNALDARDRFISIASHELRTPLTSLHGYVQLLYRKFSEKNTPEARWVKELYEESNRLIRLIKELLDINRIKQGELEFVFQEVDFAKVVEKAIHRTRFIYNTNEIIVTNKLVKRKSVIIGDTNKLLQMVTALIENAIKFSPPYSKIKILIDKNERFIIMKIKDEGDGIPKKELKRIFQGFYKISKEEKGGMGVGLLLAQHIIKNHRGKIAITSREKQGTTIEVKLPKISI